MKSFGPTKHSTIRFLTKRKKKKTKQNKKNKETKIEVSDYILSPLLHIPVRSLGSSLAAHLCRRIRIIKVWNWLRVSEKGQSVSSNEMETMCRAIYFFPPLLHAYSQHGSFTLQSLVISRITRVIWKNVKQKSV